MTPAPDRPQGCPFCGWHGATVIDGCCNNGQHDSWWFAVECGHCQARGPLGTAQMGMREAAIANAIANWLGNP